MENLPDGLYKCTNKNGAITVIRVIHGIVYIVNGFCGGNTGHSPEYFISRGMTFESMRSQ